MTTSIEILPLKLLSSVKWSRLLVVAGTIGTAVAVKASVTPETYRSTAVLGIVGAGSGTPTLGGAASLLSGALNITGAAGQPTSALVSYLLTSNIVVDSVMRQKRLGRPLLSVISGSDVKTMSPERQRRLAKKHIEVGTSRETGLLTLSLYGYDKDAVIFASNRLVQVTQDIYSAYQRSQARTIRLSQQSRVDSFARALAVAEDVARQNELTSTLARPGTNTELELRRARRERDAMEYAYQAARTESESALGRELLNAASVVVLEPAAYAIETIEPRPLFQGSVAAIASLLMMVMIISAMHILKYAIRHE